MAGAFTAHTSICVDMALPDKPITCLGMKPYDAHVNSLDQAFILNAKLDTVPSPTLPTNPLYQNPYHVLDNWREPQLLNGYGRSDSANTPSIFKFGSRQSGSPPVWAVTGEITCGEPHERKVFKRIEFHGAGSIFIRTFVDGRFISEGMVVATESPSKVRVLALPRGTKGYSVQFEMAGIFELDLIEIGYHAFPRTS